MPTFLQGRAQKAHEPPQHRFGNLYEVLNEAFLNECWRDRRQEAAYGGDGVSAQDYAAHLDANSHAVVERLKRKQSRATHVRRTYIPKGNGPRRPRGMPSVEEKLRPRAVTRRLTALYEQDCLRCSSGYRPHLGAQEAVDTLTRKLPCGQDNGVVEADLKGCFDPAS